MEEFVEFTDDVRREVIDLLHSQPGKERLWDWQYERNPLASGATRGTVLRVDGRVVGFNGIMPVRAKLDETVVDAGWSLDAHISEQFRGRGLGKRLYSLVEESKPLMLGYGMSDVSFALLTKRGWTFNTALEEYYFQNRISNGREFLKVVRQLPSVVRGPRLSGPSEIEDVPASRLPKECDALWESVQGGYDRIVVRDYPYMKWKYGDHPSQDYRALLASAGGRLQAVAIYRCGDRWGRFVDYLGPARNSELKAKLLGTFMQASRRSNRLNIITTDVEFKSCLERVGFRRYASRPQFCVRSILPIERIADGWFLMTGDSDGDLIDAMKDSLRGRVGGRE